MVDFLILEDEDFKQVSPFISLLYEVTSAKGNVQINMYSNIGNHSNNSYSKNGNNSLVKVIK